jgi:hypothetical protein
MITVFALFGCEVIGYCYNLSALQALLLEKQHLLEKTNQELNDLQEYKVNTFTFYSFLFVKKPFVHA